MQSSLPAGWLAFTGRELNPLDRYKRFQIIHPPFLDLAWRKGSFIGVPLPDRRYCTRVKGRGRAMRAWIDRTNDGLSGMPADGISLPPKKGGLRHVPLGPARRLGYINHTIGWKGT
jgi:hypothetical protein